MAMPRHDAGEMLDATKSVVYTLLHNPQIVFRSSNLSIRIPYVHGLVSALGILLPLADNHRLKILALGHLGLNIGDQILEVWRVLSHG
jgi:hypothetical protein